MEVHHKNATSQVQLSKTLPFYNIKSYQINQSNPETDEKHREAREMNLEMRCWRRSNGTLESEIASEQARSAALRDAFEGRRARYATAETAARNAERLGCRAGHKNFIFS